MKRDEDQRKKNLYSAIYGIYGNFLTAIIENENKNSSKKNQKQLGMQQYVTVRLKKFYVRH